MSIKPGLRLGERYQLLTPIATGGMGQVWRAEDTTLHRVVAAKILRSELSGDETFLERFRAEARNTAALSHPNIASVYDYGEQVHDAERLCYLVMELVEGMPLVDILARERRLSPDRTLDYLEQTAMGLAAAHRENMVHRDIKPGNLIIRPDGVLKITDFGIARAANSVALTERGTVVGTAQYLAPEQAEGKPARQASDIYALGVVGYECLAGFRPFDGDNSVAIALAQIREMPRPLPADVPPHVRALIEIAMRKNPDARYEDGSTFVTVVRAVRAGNMPPAPVIRPSQPPVPGMGGPGAGQPRLPGQPAFGPGGPGPRPGTPSTGPAGPSVGPSVAGIAGGPGVSGGSGVGGPQRPPAGRAGYGPGPGGAAAAAGPPPSGIGPGAQPTGPAPAAPPSAAPPVTGAPPTTGVPPAAMPPSGTSPSSGTGTFTPPPAGTGTFSRIVPPPSGGFPATGSTGGTGTFPTGSVEPPGSASPGAPPGASAPPGADSRAVAWFWIALGLLLIAAVIGVVIALTSGNGASEMTGSPLVSITNTELKENLR